MKQRFAAAWTVCIGLILGTGACILLVLDAVLKEPQRSAFRSVLGANAPLLVMMAIMGCIIAASIAHWITQAYFRPLHRYADMIRLIAGGNPALRIDAAGAATELRHLAAAINEFAARHETALNEVNERIDEAHASLAVERSHLAALMSELAQSVVVCNAEGRILLYNEKARVLFSSRHALAGDSTPGFFGLGRSIYALADRSALDAGHTELQRRSALNEPSPVAEFQMQLTSGMRVQARMAVARHQGDTAPVAAADGFVLLLSAMQGEGEAPLAGRSAAPAVPAVAARPIYYDFDLFRQPGQITDLDDRPLTALAFTAFDTETTGLDPSAGDEIISIGAVRIVNGRILHQEHYAQLVDPRRPLHAASIAIHGLSPDRLRGQPTIDKVLPEFFRFCEDTGLIGHNAAFDMRFLELKQRKTGVHFTQPVLDTLLLSAVLHGTLQEHSLEAIAMRLGVTIVDRHTAIGDAVTTAQVFLKLLPLLAARGILTLRQAREASAHTPYARLRY